MPPLTGRALINDNRLYWATARNIWRSRDVNAWYWRGVMRMDAVTYAQARNWYGVVLSPCRTDRREGLVVTNLEGNPPTWSLRP